MKLKEYLEMTGIRHTFFAKKIGISSSTLSFWIHNRSSPKIAQIIAIEKETLGKVKPIDWI